MGLTGLDIALLVVIAASSVIGVMRGLVKELISLVAWVAAFFVALYFSEPAAAILDLAMLDEAVQLAIGFVLVFVSVLVVSVLVQWIVGRLVEATGLSGTDRLLGLLFGSARGFLVCIVALILLRPFAEETGWWQSSSLRDELLAFEADVLDLVDQARGAMSNARAPITQQSI